MNFDLSEEQYLLKATAERLLADWHAGSRDRTAMVKRDGHDLALWTQLVELGFPGIAVPEAHGGLGLEALDLAVVAEMLGRHVAPVPFFSSICLAAQAIMLGADDVQAARLLPPIAAGKTIATLAWHEGPGTAPVGGALRVAGDRISGCKWPVPDAGIASLVVVVADRPGVGASFGVVDLSASGVTRELLEGFDRQRPHFRISFENTAVEWLARSGADMVEDLRDRGAVFAAFEQVGGAEGCLAMARDYVMQRPVFGRILGSYQAVKHRLADLLVLIELARSNAYVAAWSLTHDPANVRTTAAAARVSATRAYDFGARENLQLHGGIGFTTTVDCHYHYRRARLLSLSLGGVDFWSSRLVSAVRVAA